MQLVSAAAPKMFSDALATRSPSATLNGQRLSSGGLPTFPWPAPANSAASAQRKDALCPAAGTTARPQVRRRLRAGAIRRPRAPTTSAPVRLFDPRRHDAYAQGTDTQSTDTQRTGPPAADEIAPTSVRHADGPRVTPSAIRYEPAVGNQTIRLPRAHRRRPDCPFRFSPPQPRRPEERAHWQPTMPRRAGSPCDRPAHHFVRNPRRANPRKPDHPPSPRVGGRRPERAFRFSPPQPVRPEECAHRHPTRPRRAGSQCDRPAHHAVRNPGRPNRREPAHRPSRRACSLRPGRPFQTCPPQPVRPEAQDHWHRTFRRQCTEPPACA